MNREEMLQLWKARGVQQSIMRHDDDDAGGGLG